MDKIRMLAGGLFELSESAYDPTKGQITLTVIKPGLSKNNRMYSPELLKRSVGIFENAKMFTDHQTDGESKARPEGSVRNYVAQVTKVWPEADGTIKAHATVIDPAFKGKLDLMHQNGLLNQMGVSIRAIGEAKKNDQGHLVVESLLKARSVDFVTYAGAGGQVDMMESEADTNDIDLMTEAQLRTRRPDLIELVESRKEAKIMEKSVAEQIAEAVAPLNAKLVALETENGTLKANEATSKKAATQAQIATILTESKLPAIASDRLKKQFENAVEVTGVKEAVEAEVAYIKSITTVAKNNGSNQQESVDETAVEKAASKAKLVKTLQESMGLTEAQAKEFAN